MYYQSTEYKSHCVRPRPRQRLATLRVRLPLQLRQRAERVARQHNLVLEAVIIRALRYWLVVAEHPRPGRRKFPPLSPDQARDEAWRLPDGH